MQLNVPLRFRFSKAAVLTSVSHSLLCDKQSCAFCKLLPFYVQFRACLLIPSPVTVKVKTVAWEIGLCKSVTSSQQTTAVFKARCGGAWESSQLSTNAALYKCLLSFQALKEAADLINPGGILSQNPLCHHIIQQV